MPLAGSRSRLRESRGAILVELLVTVIIISGGVLFLVDSVRQSGMVAKRVQSTQQALVVGREAIGEILSGPPLQGALPSGQRLLGGTTFGWEVVEKRPLLDERFPSDTWLLSLRVSWEDGDQRAVELPFVWRLQG